MGMGRNTSSEVLNALSLDLQQTRRRHILSVCGCVWADGERPHPPSLRLDLPRETQRDMTSRVVHRAQQPLSANRLGVE
jgi:hypothetical protein